jgi:hypothetical protein
MLIKASNTTFSALRQGNRMNTLELAIDEHQAIPSFRRMPESRLSAQNWIPGQARDDAMHKKLGFPSLI